MKNLLGALLTIAGIALVIYGITLFGDSEDSASLLGLHFSVKDNGLQTQAFMVMGLGLVSLIGGFFVIRKR